jgi:hypothetical protein
MFGYHFRDDFLVRHTSEDVVKKLLLALALGSVSITAFADNCDEIKSQIDAKIKALGVPLYKLQVVDTSTTVGGKVVGTCDGGKKKIIYLRF